MMDKVRWLLVLGYALAVLGLWVILAQESMASPCPYPHRSELARRQFARLHPCPATGEPSPHCPGYVIDHIVPLCACGPDDPVNMQWQTIAEAKRKDRRERRQCR